MFWHTTIDDQEDSCWQIEDKQLLSMDDMLGLGGDESFLTQSSIFVQWGVCNSLQRCCSNDNFGKLQVIMLCVLRCLGKFK